MATSKLAILIETLYKGKGVKDATKDMGALEDQAGKTTKKTGGMSIGLKNIAIAAGVAGAAMYAAKKAFDLGLEGENLMRTRDSFDALAKSIDETSDSLMGKMREATMGMVSDTELMRASARTMSMGLASTGDEAAKLAEIAVALGAAMGKEAGPAMEEFGLLLANQSTLRLDTFGISAARVKERIKELKEETPGLSSETAFMTATMEQAEISMDKLGDSIKPGEYAQATAEVQNLKDEFAMLTSKALNPAVKALGNFLREARELREEVKRIEKATVELDKLAKQAGLTQKEYDRLLDSVIDMSKGAKDSNTILRREELALRALVSGLRLTTQGAATYAVAQDKANISAKTMEGIWQRMTERGIEVGIATEDATDATEGFTIAIERTTSAYDDMKGPMVAVTGAYDDMAVAAETGLSKAEQAARDYRAEVDRLKLAILGLKEPTEAMGLAIWEVWNDAQEEAKAAAIETHEYGKAVEEEADKIAGYWDPARQMLIDMNDEMDEMDGREIHTTMYLDRIVTEQTSTPGEGDPDRPDTPGGPRAQHGLDMVVPPGFRNDSYPIWTTSGEHVQVTPKGKGAAGGSPIVNVTVYTGSGNPDIIGNKVAGRVAEVLGVRG